MSKFSTVVLTVAGIATVAMIGVAASATAATLPMMTSSSSSSTSTSSGSPSASPSASATTSPPAPTTSAPAPAPDPSAITADIYVEIDFVGSSGPKTFAVTGVPVGAGPELTGADVQTDPSDHCGALAVDVSLDPTTITVTGIGACSYSDAYVKVTLHGMEFSSTTVLSDALFSPVPDKNMASGLLGGSYKSRGAHFGPTDPYPVLDSYGVTGSTFSAFWSGGATSPMDGVSVFSWVPVALAGPAAAADPTFTG